ncbi:ATP-NAD kinase [Nonomuraea sp. NN258]|uniref:ATP-NAD kinase family protein n=1 Tax=Nonomuraea antri TaxID=2730852 RepID=UPI001569D1E3|nr:NAD(+)/NADH kinase [Nonomuraea antri]NRQ33872.1 ATP-NAD kinase [Nonomuraea antri]
MGTSSVGLIVNPVAGLGGAAGLKGSDGADVQREALARGATPRAAERAARAMRTLLARRPDVRVVTVAGAMGEHSAGVPAELVSVAAQGETSAADTRAAVAALAGVDLLLFAGGDGTARDVLDAVRPLGDQAPPVLGIPAGVKVYSGCFALSPAAAGFLAADFLAAPGPLTEAEVVDLDEERYRHGLVSPRLYGTLRVPAARAALAGRKVGSSSAAPATAEGIAREVVARMRPGVRYVLGPGATTLAVGRELGLATTLLGVDVVESGDRGLGTLTAADVGESDLLALVRERETVVVLSVIGGQGFVLGRGNQQVSPRVLDAVLNAGGAGERLVVLATQQKLAALGGRALLADSGDDELDQKVSGHVQVITGYRESTIYRIEAAGKEFHG